VDIKVDIGGALKKTAALAKTPEAAKKQLERWGSQTVLMLMQSARDMKRSGSGRKTGQLARSVGMKMDSGKLTTLIVGTNVKKQTDVKYAKIQDEGGTIRPKGHPYLAIPLKGIKDRPKDHPGAFVIETKRGRVFLAEREWSKAGGAGKGWRGSGYKPGLRLLFLLKTEVTLPATYWFRNPTRRMESLLPGFMDPRVILDEAAKMAGVGSIK